MCRLLAYVSTTKTALNSLLSDQEVNDFENLSALHCDGWGMAWLMGSNDDQSNLTIGTTNSISRALDDPEFDQRAKTPLGRAGLIHIRWATPGFPVRIENTHPFKVDGWAFAHNGAIRHPERILDLLHDDSKRRLRGDTDSECYFNLILQRIAESNDPLEGVRAAIADIRVACRLGSLNCILLSDKTLIAVQSQGETSAPLKTLRASVADPADLPPGHDETYYNLRYARRNGSLVISSTGMDGEDWEALSEDSVIMVDLTTNQATIYPLAGTKPIKKIVLEIASPVG